MPNHEYYIENKDHILAVNAEYRKNNRSAIREQQQDNRDYYIDKSKRRYDTVKDDPIFIMENRARVKEWKVQNKAKVIAATKLRDLLQKNRVPIWADIDQITEIYKNCPAGCHVDHIIPLQGKEVCGLHVEYNLQYLTAEENLKKGNKLWQ